jgi:hypothetical protein
MAPLADGRAARSTPAAVGLPTPDKTAGSAKTGPPEGTQMTAQPKDIPTLTLRTQITIEITALDYVEAAEHQRRAEALFAAVSAEYPTAAFSFHHVRPKVMGRARGETDGRSDGRPRRYKTRPRALAVYHDS